MLKRPNIALIVMLMMAASPLWAGVLDKLEQIGAPVRIDGQREFLPPDQAFRLTERLNPAGQLELRWEIEPGYYLYRDKTKLTATTAGAILAATQLPAGEFKEDPEFGRVEVYKHELTITAAIEQAPASGDLLEAEVRYQGCAEDGICYPPIKKTVAFSLLSAAHAAASPPPSSAPSSTAAAVGRSASDRIAQQLGERSLTQTLLTFLGLGLLLAFTPCVLPMVPILSGIIVGQQQPVSTLRAVALSSVYVLAMALTYTLAGIVAGLAGKNLQAAFQHPLAISAFAAVFVALALSMFGFYELQLPSALQSKLDNLSRKQRSGSITGVAVMGVLSAVIVGPCVAPPLAGALAYIGQTGSPLIGGAALFALGLGMGLPLIAVGASAGALLPRAGQWMERVKAVFGVIFLAVAVWFVERIVPPGVALMLWAALLIGCAVFLGALTRSERGAPATARVAQAAGLVLLVYGVILIVGASAGADDPLSPLSPLAGRSAVQTETTFIAIKSSADLDQQLSRAAAAGQAVMLDFYADWCVECKHLERQTFSAEAVQQRLNQMVLLRADVTADDAIDRALLQRYGLFGPPAVLFFHSGTELRSHRLEGFADATTFSTLLDRVAATP